MNNIPLRLHIGCGKVYKKNYINVDKYDITVADVASDAKVLPFLSGVFDGVESYHLIEHLGYIGAIFNLFEYYRVLKDGGDVIVETPHIEASFQKFLDRKDRETRAKLLGWIFGEETPGLSHTFLFHPDLLKELFYKTGFSSVEFHNPSTYLYEPGVRIYARKISNPWYELLAIFHNYLLPFSKAPDEFVEFENTFINNLISIFSCEHDPAFSKYNKDRILFENLVISAPLLLQLFILLLESNPSILPDIEFWVKRCRELISFQFNQRLILYTLELAKHGEEADYDTVFKKATQWLEDTKGSLGEEEKQFGVSFGENVLKNERVWDVPEIFTQSYIDKQSEKLRALGIRSFSHEKLQKSLDYFEESSCFTTGRIVSIWNKGIIKALLGDLDGAVKAYKKVIEFGVNYPSLYLELAIIKMHLGDFQEAFIDLAEIMDSPLREFYRAITLFHMGDIDWAQEIFKKLTLCFNHPALNDYLNAKEKNINSSFWIPPLRQDLITDINSTDFL